MAAIANVGVSAAVGAGLGVLAGLVVGAVIAAVTVGSLLIALPAGLARAAVGTFGQTPGLGGQSARAKGKPVPRRTKGLTTAEQNDLPASKFAFPEARKEPLTDARHVRNAIARFDQVEGVSDADRDQAWKRIRAAAKKFDVDVEAKDWRELFVGGKAKKR